MRKTVEHEAWHGARAVVPAPPAGGSWWRLERPVGGVCARQPGDVLPALEAVERAAAQGLHAAGFICYEAAPAMDAALRTAPPGDWPLAWFAFFEQALPWEPPPPAGGTPPAAVWTPDTDAAAYARALARIRGYLQGGATYQVNYTFRLRKAWEDPDALFARLFAAQEARYAALLDAGRWAVCSASPELFFALDGERLVSRPMKGTAPRGRWSAEDDARGRDLQASLKNRAENVMIVDMIRNDMGRVARAGSVRAEPLFTLERYPTVWQLTSTVEARTGAGLADLMRALFPCASITGAPKVETMRIIRELERSPRGVYTGAVGYWGPGRRGLFNVPIRTVALDRAAGTAEYGVGGGVVWDSVDQAEYEECRTKAAVLGYRRPAFELLETLAWEPGQGYLFEEEHAARMQASAAYFGFAWRREDWRAVLEGAAARFGAVPMRMRVTGARDGRLAAEAAPLETRPVPWRVALAAAPVDAGDRFLYHKTTHRDVYERARAARPDADDVLLWNAQGELTESCIANVLVERGGGWVTPPLACGLLPGIGRARLLREGRVREAVVGIDALRPGTHLELVNSVRGRVPAVVIGPA